MTNTTPRYFAGRYEEHLEVQSSNSAPEAASENANGYGMEEGECVYVAFGVLTDEEGDEPGTHRIDVWEWSEWRVLPDNGGPLQVEPWPQTETS